MLARSAQTHGAACMAALMHGVWVGGPPVCLLLYLDSCAGLMI